MPSANAETISVADYGIVPGKDVTYAVKQLLDSVKGKLEVTLSFPPGQYDFHPENAWEQYRAVANHDNGLKRLGFPLMGHRNLTIDGGGSTFLFHGRVVPFTLDNCERITLKNFTIDFSKSFHAELTVDEIDEQVEQIVVTANPEAYPYTIQQGEILFHRYGQDDPFGSNIVIDPKTRSPIYRTGLYKLNAKKARFTDVGAGRIRIQKGFKQLPPVGSVLVAYGVHPTSRLCHAMQVANSKDIRIENVTIHDAGGMALIVERTENITLDRMVVTSNDERLVATRADATHFIGCRGTIQLENCLFEHMLDDGINVHGAYVKLVKRLDGDRLLCEISHFQQWGLTFAESGDEVALLSRETILPFTNATVTSVENLNEHRFVLTLDGLPPSLPDVPMSLENLSWYPDLVMRNNTIREARARSVLVTTKGKVLIENNTFASQMHGILIEGDNNKWYESGAVEDVMIRNNLFDNVGYAVDRRYPLLASPLLRPEQRVDAQRYHRNIRFVDNTIRSFNGLMVRARTVDGLEIKGNRIELHDAYALVGEGPSILLESCDGVEIENNEAIGFVGELRMQADESSTVEARNNAGFKGL